MADAVTTNPLADKARELFAAGKCADALVLLEELRQNNADDPKVRAATPLNPPGAPRALGGRLRVVLSSLRHALCDDRTLFILGLCSLGRCLPRSA